MDDLGLALFFGNTQVEWVGYGTIELHGPPKTYIFRDLYEPGCSSTPWSLGMVNLQPEK